MGGFVSYTLQSSIVLLGLYVIYKWLLAPRNEPTFNRTVILCIYAVSIIAPSVSLHRPGAVESGHISIGSAEVGFIGQDVTESLEHLSDYILWGYFAVVAVLVLCSALAWLRIALLVRRGDKRRHNTYTVVVTDRLDMAPFSWFGYIIINRKDVCEGSGEIFTHEEAHMRLRHMADLIVAQLFEIFMWYNPAAWLMAHELRAVHEFQADRAVLRSGADARSYQLMLIKKAVGSSFPTLANSLNHSNLKKRITMMQKAKSSKRGRMLAFAMAPALVAALMVTRQPAVAACLSALSSADMEMRVADKGTENIPETAQTSSAIESRDDEQEIYSNPEVLPQYPGGEVALMNAIAENIEYPASEKNNPGIHRVVVRFLIETDGSISNITIVRSEGEAFDNAAIEAIKKLGKFIPGAYDGKPVRVTYCLPITFKIK